MRVVVVTPPDPVISLDQAKQHLRVDADDDDALITGLVASATEHLDCPAGWLGRAIGLQTLQVRGAFFDRCGWSLPFPPVLSVTTIEYLDPNGVVQVLDPSLYEVRGAAIAPAWQHSWPAVRRDDESVRVTYQAGYETVPATIRAAIQLMVGDLYRFRETATTGQVAAVPMSITVENLLAPLRVWA